MVFSYSVKANCKKCGAVTFPYFGTEDKETKPDKEMDSKLSQSEVSNNRDNKVKQPLVGNSVKTDDKNIDKILDDFVSKYPFVAGLIHLDKIKNKEIENKKSSKIQTSNSGNIEIIEEEPNESSNNRIQEKKSSEAKTTIVNSLVETWRCKNCFSAEIVKNSF